MLVKKDNTEKTPHTMPAPDQHTKWGNPTQHTEYTPQQLWDKACQYFDWCDQNPWIKMQPKKGSTTIPANFEGDTTELLQLLGPTIAVPTTRPYTLDGLCNYLDINRQDFDTYATKPCNKAYFDICTRVNQIINTQQFEGAMVGTFNASIVMRKLGLSDKKELTAHQGKEPVKTVYMKVERNAKSTFPDNEQKQDHTTQATFVF